MINIGVLCPSEIAVRRFMPALLSIPSFKFYGIASANSSEWENSTPDIINSEKNKVVEFTQQYPGKIFHSYNELISDPYVDAIYIPMPPALHFKWAEKCLKAGKHILVEKPFCTSLEDTNNLIKIANSKGLAIHENYMFIYHRQIVEVDNIIKSGQLGEIRLYRISFGFPRRAKNDFRYNKNLGGGALLDCGGYTIKYASILLGDTTKVRQAQLNFTNEFEVDLFGSGSLSNEEGLTAQIAFGMDNNYKCELEVWGSKGGLRTNRIFTSPSGYIPTAEINTNNMVETIELPEDDSFRKSIIKFYDCINNSDSRQKNYSTIHRQAKLLNDFLNKANN